jgi:hypothetical protein
MPLMPMPPIPTKWMGPISRGSLMVGSLTSSSAIADDPVFRDGLIQISRAEYWMPRFRGA